MLDETASVTDFVNLHAATPAGQQIKSSTFHLIGEDYNLRWGSTSTTLRWYMPTGCWWTS
jgi:hypothetical protein